MKFISWNVNGLRAICGKGFPDTMQSWDADFVCLQETKLQEGQIDLSIPGYESYWSYALKKGYSGVAVFTRHKPLSVTEGVASPDHDAEGRALTLEYTDFYLVCVYSPNSQGELKRIDFRLAWEEALLQHLRALDAKKPVILCGDLNVAHTEIDLRNPEKNHESAGFSDGERGAFTTLLDAGFADTFRRMHPDRTEAYSWWSYMYKARQRNDGWRIDYFVVSDRLMPKVRQAEILADVLGSDHAPVLLDLDV